MELLPTFGLPTIVQVSMFFVKGISSSGLSVNVDFELKGFLILFFAVRNWVMIGVGGGGVKNCFGLR